MKSVYFSIIVTIMLLLLLLLLTIFPSRSGNLKLENTTLKTLPLGNISELDKLLQSEHGFQISDCLNVNVSCNEDQECLAVCSDLLKSWSCNNNTNSCELKYENSMDKPRCIYGILKSAYDFDKKKLIYDCVCNSTGLYYGPDCSKPVPFCDKVKHSKCICDSSNILFKFNKEYQVCIPKKHYTLFINQDHFECIDEV